MNATLTESNTTTNYTFNIEHEGEQYNVTVYLNESGKFIDESITNDSGYELEYEGEEGQIREDIMDYLDENWDKLVG
jgi:hypothetical protein